MDRAALRILDAAANRAREGLRVMEDVARFALDDASITSMLKSLRHDVSAALDSLPIPPAALLASRNTPGDVGTGVSTNTEYARRDLGAVAAAACKRVQEALRSLEEVAKTLPGGASVARQLEAARYCAYDAEKRIAQALERRRLPTPFPGFRLCVLLTESLCRHHSWMDVARMAIEGGADCIQLREKELEGRELLRRARELVALTRGSACRVVINDRPDIAILAGADGVHLGQGDLPASEARALFDRAGIVGHLIGVSTFHLDEAGQAQRDGADYCGVGPMFPTTTKTKDRLAGPARLRAYLERSPALPPAVAIGGITEANIGELRAVGATGVAVSSAVCAAGDPRRVVESLLASLSAGGAAPATLPSCQSPSATPRCPTG